MDESTRDLRVLNLLASLRRRSDVFERPNQHIDRALRIERARVRKDGGDGGEDGDLPERANSLRNAAEVAQNAAAVLEEREVVVTKRGRLDECRNMRKGKPLLEKCRTKRTGEDWRYATKETRPDKRAPSCCWDLQ